MTPAYSLIYASARPHLIADVIDLWEKRCRRPENVEWWVCVNENIDGGNFPKISERIAYILIQPPFTRIRAYNEAAKMSTGNWLVCVADDWVPCDGWDAKLGMETCCNKHRYPVVIHIFDGHKKDLITHPIMSRAFYQQERCFLNPSYTHWFADEDCGSVAKLRARLVRKDLGFEHKHPDFGGREKDATDLALTDEIKERDRLVFEQRRKDGFPLLKP